ncbi:MAG: helix-turn-helix transcriptional regulator [Phycisphaerae bacterium]
MKITEKLLRLTEGQRKADIARAAKLKPTQLNDYTVKGSLPRYDIALRIARALKVPVEWLIDDEADWPPPVPNAAPSPSQYSDNDLMFEVARRWRLYHLALSDALNDAEKVDWIAVEQAIERMRKQPDRPNSDILWNALRPVMNVFNGLVFMKFQYNPSDYAMKHHAEMPGCDRPKEEFDSRNVWARAGKLWTLPGFRNWCRMMVGDSLPKEIQNAVVDDLVANAIPTINTTPLVGIPSGTPIDTSKVVGIKVFAGGAPPSIRPAVPDIALGMKTVTKIHKKR